MDLLHHKNEIGPLEKLLAYRHIRIVIDTSRCCLNTRPISKKLLGGRTS